MNPYIQNLKRIEFVITYVCSGRCKHCSEADHYVTGDHIDGDTAAEMIFKTAEAYPIKSLMTFGGEPLLYPESVYKIQVAARKIGIPKCQLITNGFFSQNTEKIRFISGFRNCSFRWECDFFKWQCT